MVDASFTGRVDDDDMASTDRYLNLAKGVIPGVAAIIFVIVRIGSQAGFFIVPFVAVALLGIVQAIRSSGVIDGFSSRTRRRGSIDDTAHRGRSIADELLDER